ncbi:MAG: LOW QUALITY PROTEIN: P-loop containing nucleoside triphosphate hydrolase protein [Olpidium bornovanus]|uniref:P-loop containing nucleoside triphosphate hydrolase protein n=1 Tax=Olpidium bornovanus TaxID=278681 RepID=A0A8H7ZS62_9FUNG|nr:MAG: LOW QUALITY PROTEIN: P-loop containing nucleoside triphosphate hydrolase protein [Olpidium bornovanus]
MPPKKQQAADRILLGRPGNNLKMGVVGLPNVGKSTFFNALTNSSAPAEVNIPASAPHPAFLVCGAGARRGPRDAAVPHLVGRSSRAELPLLHDRQGGIARRGPRFQNREAVRDLQVGEEGSWRAVAARAEGRRPVSTAGQGRCALPTSGRSKPKRPAVPSDVVPTFRVESRTPFVHKPTPPHLFSRPPCAAYLSVIDIAGLVKGAAEGEGLGNAFLSHIKAVDGIFHVCRAFDDADVIHVEGEVDPVRDLEIIHRELLLKDEEFISKQEATRAKDKSAQGDKLKKEELEIVRKVLDWVSVQRKDVREGVWNNKEVEFINTLQLITAKPVVYLVNLSEKDYVRKKNKWLVKIKQWGDENHPGDLLIPCSVALELKLTQMETDAEREAYLKTLQQKYEVSNPVTSVLPKIILAGYSALNLVYCNIPRLFVVRGTGYGERRWKSGFPRKETWFATVGR